MGAWLTPTQPMPVTLARLLESLGDAWVIGQPQSHGFGIPQLQYVDRY